MSVQRFPKEIKTYIRSIIYFDSAEEFARQAQIGYNVANLGWYKDHVFVFIHVVRNDRFHDELLIEKGEEYYTVLFAKFGRFEPFIKTQHERAILPVLKLRDPRLRKIAGYVLKTMNKTDK